MASYTIDARVFLNAFNPHEPGRGKSRTLLARLLERALTIIAPELTGYIATTPKKLSKVLITADNDDPIPGCLRFGLGKTVAFTSDLAGSWTRRLIEWKHFVLARGKDSRNGGLDPSHEDSPSKTPAIHIALTLQDRYRKMSKIPVFI